jgi:hypothetical protein
MEIYVQVNQILLLWLNLTDGRHSRDAVVLVAMLYSKENYNLKPGTKSRLGY